MKKIWILLLSLLLCCSCVSKKAPEVDFDTFLTNATSTLLEGTTSFNLNFLFNEPSVESTTYGLGFIDEEGYLETMDQYEQLLDSLHQYTYDSLSPSMQVVYVAFEDYLKRQLVLRPYYYYENPYIGSYSSLIQELPLLLQMYTFHSKTDLDHYFKNIQAFKEDFKKAVELEKERQRRNLGYSKEILDQTKNQLQNIIQEGGISLMEATNQTIDSLSFLNDSQKEHYKTLNKQAISIDLMGAYQTLYDGLCDIEGKKENTAHLDKTYYKALLYHQLGTKTSLSDIEKDLYDSFESHYDTLIELLTMNPDLLECEDLYDIKYSEFNSPVEGLDYLKTKISTLVPTIDNLSYEVSFVPESLQEGFAPAAYLTPKVDQYDDQKERILINPQSTTNLFPTLVHEGYPGHMYQSTYLSQKDYPDIMYLFDCIGYSEGWAIYMENRSWELLEENRVWQKVVLENDAVTSTLLALIDIGIHYKGWDYNDCISFYNQHTGANLSNELEELYNILLQNPGYYLYYIYAGEWFHQLYEKTKTDLGSSFDDVTFHQMILDSGEVGLDVLKNNIKKANK